MNDDRSQPKSADAFPTTVNGQITDAVPTGGAEGEEDPSEGDPS